ncbi:CHAT domain-containing protein [Umezawaea sp.]|uniref:CHAT domain-containing protein n=1 Tax=Umezawaea sp. TaxID=1955258 RepID=UPI002ED062CE
MTLHAECLEEVERGHLPRARALAREGLRRATTDHERARFHLTLAWIELDRGRPKASTSHLTRAFPHLRGNDLARARCLQGLHLCQTADPGLAAAHLTGVIRDLKRHDDPRWLANALVGRGIARAHSLRLAEADADFTAARRTLLAIGEPDRAAMCLHNRGFVAMVAGDLPTALRHYEQAAHDGLTVAHRPEALIDRAEALLAAGLVREARSVLTPAISLLDRCDRGSRLPDAVLLAARCALADGDLRQARVLADQVGGWVARSVSLRARLAAGERPAVRRTATECDRRGRHEDAAELRLAAGLPLDVRRGTARLRALGLLDTARRASTRREAATACRAGLALVDPTTWPGTELRDIALRHALMGGDARSVLRWTRRVAPVAPTTEHSAELRLARARADHDRVVALEREIRRRALTTRPTPPRPAARTTRLAFTEHDGVLHAVTVVAGRARLHRLAPLDHRTSALRLALESGRDTAAELAAAALDALLPPTGDGPITITGSPAGLPWAALPSYRGRPFSLDGAPARSGAPPRTGAWIAGPELTHATEEVSTLHRAHGGTLLTGRSATVDAALRAMDGVDVVHVAAHGRARGLFSSLQLADGDLHIHDLARLRRPPGIVVLSSCDSGLATAFLDRGAGAVIASTLAVPDDRTPAFMTTVHAGLRAGLDPATALAEARLLHDDRSFSCSGPG